MTSLVGTGNVAVLPYSWTLLRHLNVTPELEDRANPSKFSHPLIKNGLQWALSFPLQNFNLAPVIWHLACDLAKLRALL